MKIDMKPEELMIGDLVMHGFGGIGKITEIDSKTVVIKDDGFDTGDGMNEVSFALNELTPIPLTPEILEKNGWFPLDEYRYEGDIALAKGRNYFRLKNTTICINSVHELQHALRLCGINKEIEI